MSRDRDRIELAHGGGGRRMQELLRGPVAAAFGQAAIRHDGAVLEGDL